MSTVTASDLRRQFPREVVDIVLDLQDKGAVIRRTKAGHLNIKSSVNNETMSVSRNSGSGRVPVHKVKQDADRLYPPAPETLAKGDFSGWDKDIKEIVLKAVNDYGWKYEWRRVSGGTLMVIITSPDGLKKLDFTAGSKPISPNLQGLRRIILQHGKLQDTKSWDIKNDAEPTLLTDPAIEEKPVPVLEAPPTPADVAVARHIVHERPWLAKRGDSRGYDRRYESKVVLEREWSDGALDYVCTYEGCEYPPQAKPRSVSAHAANAHTDGTGRKPQPSLRSGLIVTTPHTDPLYRKAYSPRGDRVEALAEWLIEKFDGGNLETQEDFERIAREALIWQHEQSGGDKSAESEELTAEEVLVRIRQMVDNGEYVRQRSRIDALEDELQAARRDAQACRARADDLAGSLGALKELLGGLDITTDGTPT